MTTETASPASVSLRRWMDWWCEPPWRALLTWGALAALSAWARDCGVLRWMVQEALLFTDWEAKVSPAFSDFSLRLILPVNSFILLVWFEPFVLRFNPARGLAWLGLRMGLLVIGDFYPIHRPLYTLYMLWSLTLVVWSILAAAILYRWRSRPWVSVIGGVLMASTHYLLLQAAPNLARAVLWSGFIYAAVVLFGTARIETEPDPREFGLGTTAGSPH